MARAALVVCALSAAMGAAAYATEGVADAKPKARATSRPAAHAKPKAKAKPKARPKHRTRATHAHRADNMPAGWVWPPSRAMRRQGAACLAKLDSLGVKYKRASAVNKIATPITVPSMELGGLKLTSIWRRGPFEMDCQLALALETYGPALRAAGVHELQFSRIWGYTNVRVNGTTKPFLSRHALGLAIDVYAMVGDDGHKAIVEPDYLAGDPLLLAVEQAVNDSGGFRLCLTPKNDPVSHHDHFHLEAKVVYPSVPERRVSARAHE